MGFTNIDINKEDMPWMESQPTRWNFICEIIGCKYKDEKISNLPLGVQYINKECCRCGHIEGFFYFHGSITIEG